VSRLLFVIVQGGDNIPAEDQFETLQGRLVLASRELDFVPTKAPEEVRYVGPQLEGPACR